MDVRWLPCSGFQASCHSISKVFQPRSKFLWPHSPRFYEVIPGATSAPVMNWSLDIMKLSMSTYCMSSVHPKLYIYIYIYVCVCRILFNSILLGHLSDFMCNSFHWYARVPYKQRFPGDGINIRTLNNRIQIKWVCHIKYIVLMFHTCLQSSPGYKTPFLALS
jgi:hypothetical protein